MWFIVATCCPILMYSPASCFGVWGLGFRFEGLHPSTTHIRAEEEEEVSLGEARAGSKVGEEGSYVRLIDFFITQLYAGEY